MKTLKPIIKEWDCITHDPIENWEPEDRSMVEFWCNISIGIEGQKGADNFNVHVTTEKMLSQLAHKDYILVIPYYESWSQVLNILNTKVNDISGINWQGISLELSKMFQWEYENYKP
ncbi:MAG: hypothetical protein HKN88_10165 [Gammaproteobacteria bacterium]|nr:immunity 8 family protein [Gammaproteobacteria bacterium]NNC98420.1 hypothetical protein [Gammaproteobacteria bacterium]